jgi:two-component system response regulator LytT
MNCIIIEDADKAVKRFESQLDKTGYDISVEARIDSVKEAVSWLQSNQTDLIFLDIQLGDGLGFEIFDHVQVKTPVVFTTSYAEYMARAFEVNSLSYLLKPVTQESLKAALDKFMFLQAEKPEEAISINTQVLPMNRKYQLRFLARNGEHLESIAASDVAWFYVQNKHFLFLMTKDKRQLLYDSTLEILEQRLNPEQFFRLNRQYIVGFDAIKTISGYDGRGRLLVEINPPVKEEIIVSRYRSRELKEWLDR